MIAPQSHQAPSPPITGALLRQFTLRHWFLFPARTILLLLLLALGIAVFLSIRLANRAAVSSFSNFAGILAHQSDAVISSPAGPLPEAVLDGLRAQCRLPGLALAPVEIIPIVETLCAEPPSADATQIGSRSTFSLVGVDLVALQNLAIEAQLDTRWFGPRKEGTTSPTTENSAENLLQKKNAVFCSSTLAQRLKLQPGDALRVVLNDQEVALQIAGIIPSRADQPNAPASLLIMDLPALQALSNKEGLLDRVELIFPKALKGSLMREQILTQLRTALGPKFSVRPPESRQAAAEVMTRGFRLNLTVLSLIALLVGLYLIFQALDAAVVRRRGEIAVLRALGVREWEVRRAWLWEAALLGIIGGALGVLGGWALAQFTVRAVSKTVNALYYANQAEAASLHWGEALGAFVLSVICSVAAGWLPAKRAASTPPAQVWAQGTTALPTGSPKGVKVTGFGFLAMALTLALLPAVPMDGGTRFALAGYISALLGVVGAGLVAGDALKLAAECARWFSRDSSTLQLASSHLRTPTSRHRWAVAGLLCAVAMTGGMAVLVGSFERSVSAWIGHTLQADLFLTSDANQAASAFNRIPATTWRKIVQSPEVADWDTSLMIPVELPLGQIRLVGSILAFAQRHQQLSWLQAPTDASIFDASRNATLCLVSETFATRFQLHRGDSVQIPTPNGPRTLEIRGVYTDFGDDQGLVLVDASHLAGWFATEAVSTLCLTLKPGADPEQLRSQLRAAHPGIAVFTNAHLRSEVMRIFRQTFAITYALEAIGVIVALAGLGITLASILAERKPELITLRALGMSRAEIAAVAAWEGTLLAVAGTLGGLLCSLGLGALLIFVINKQTFGWTLQPALPLTPLLLLGFCVPCCGTLVAWFVGRQIAELPSERSR